jgi:hypothetical protein
VRGARPNTLAVVDRRRRATVEYSYAGEREIAGEMHPETTAKQKKMNGAAHRLRSLAIWRIGLR